jgi:hypothetical protein
MEQSKAVINNVGCTVTSCAYNASKGCAAKRILVSAENDGGSVCADCMTYKPKADSR